MRAPSAGSAAAFGLAKIISAAPAAVPPLISFEICVHTVTESEQCAPQAKTCGFFVPQIRERHRNHAENEKRTVHRPESAGQAAALNELSAENVEYAWDVLVGRLWFGAEMME